MKFGSYDVDVYTKDTRIFVTKVNLTITEPWVDNQKPFNSRLIVEKNIVIHVRAYINNPYKVRSFQYARSF